MDPIDPSFDIASPDNQDYVPSEVSIHEASDDEKDSTPESNPDFNLILILIWFMDPPQPVSTCVLYKYHLIVVCREQAVLCDDLYLTVIHIIMWAAPNEACY